MISSIHNDILDSLLPTLFSPSWFLNSFQICSYWNSNCVLSDYSVVGSNSHDLTKS